MIINKVLMGIGILTRTGFDGREEKHFMERLPIYRQSHYYSYTHVNHKESESSLLWHIIIIILQIWPPCAYIHKNHHYYNNPKSAYQAARVKREKKYINGFRLFNCTTCTATIPIFPKAQYIYIYTLIVYMQHNSCSNDFCIACPAAAIQPSNIRCQYTIIIFCILVYDAWYFIPRSAHRVALFQFFNSSALSALVYIILCRTAESSCTYRTTYHNVIQTIYSYIH